MIRVDDETKKLIHESQCGNRDTKIRDRYYGVNDPLANKMINKMKERSTLEPPEDKSRQWGETQAHVGQAQGPPRRRARRGSRWRSPRHGGPGWGAHCCADHASGSTAAVSTDRELQHALVRGPPSSGGGGREGRERHRGGRQGVCVPVDGRAARRRETIVKCFLLYILLCKRRVPISEAHKGTEQAQMP